MRTMTKAILAWMLWLWLSVVIVGAVLYAPAAEGFLGESSRILFFHVPMAWVSFVAFMAAGIWSLRFLFAGRRREHDRKSAAAVEIGLVFCILATLTGSMWARTMWGAFWNWDPRQISIVMLLIFYAAYLALRGALQDQETRARLSAVYAVLGLVVTPFFLFVVPRLGFSLHPDSVVNTRGTIDIESRMLQVLFASWIGFQILFFWLHNLLCRVQILGAGPGLQSRNLTGARIE